MREVDTGLDVCGREDADGMMRNFRNGDRPLDIENAGEGCPGAEACGRNSLSLELVDYGADRAFEGRGKMSPEEDREGEGVRSPGEMKRMCEERPILDLGVLVCAVVAVWSERSFLGDVDVESCIESFHLEVVIVDVEVEQPRDEGASAVLGIAIKDGGW